MSESQFSEKLAEKVKIRPRKATHFKLGRDYSEEISGMSQLRGTNFTTMDNSKSYVKSERPSKGGSKKPSSSIFKHHEDA